MDTGPQYPRDLFIDEIEQLLPHRGGILFARHVRLLASDHYLGFVTWDLDSMGIAGHFPSLPVIPAVYLIEAAAQAAGTGMLAASHERGLADAGRIGVLAGVRRCVFMQPVFPGQQVMFDLNVQPRGDAFALVRASAAVDGHRVAQCELMLAAAERSAVFKQDRER